MRIERVRIEKLNFIPMKNQRQNAAWHFNFFKSIYAACRCREKNKTFLFCLKTTSYSAFQDLFLLTGHVSYLPFGSPAQTIVFPSNPFSNVESVLNWSTQVSFLRMRIVAFNKTSLSLEPEIRKKKQKQKQNITKLNPRYDRSLKNAIKKTFSYRLIRLPILKPKLCRRQSVLAHCVSILASLRALVW